MTSLKGTLSKFQLEFTTHVQKTIHYVEEQVEKATSLLTGEVQSLRRELSMEQQARQGDRVRFEQLISLLTARVDALESKRGVQRASPLKTPGEGIGIQVSSLSAEVQLLKRQFDSIRECLSGLEERLTVYDIKHVPELGQLGAHFKGHVSELSELKLGLAKLKIDCESNETILQHLKAKLPAVSSGGTSPSSKVSTPTTDRLNLVKVQRAYTLVSEQVNKVQGDVLGCMQDCAAIRNDISAASNQHKSSVDDAIQTLRSELTSHVTTMHQSSGLTGSYFAPTATPRPKDPRVVTFGVDPTGNPLSPQPSLSHRDASHHDAFNESEVGLESGYPRASAAKENPKVHHPYGLPVHAYELSRQTQPVFTPTSCATSHSQPVHRAATASHYSESEQSIKSDAVPRHPGTPPASADPKGDWRHCKGLDLRFFDSNLFFDPYAPLEFSDGSAHGSKFPKVKPSGVPQGPGLAFAEVPPYSQDNETEDSAPYPVGSQPGPGLFGNLSTPFLDHKTLTETQALATVPHWDGSGETGIQWWQEYRIWDNDVGRGLGDAVRRRVLRAAIPAKLGAQFTKRIVRRCQGYEVMKAMVRAEVFRRANPDVISDAWKAIELPSEPTALDAAAFMDDWCYYGVRVKGGVTHQAARDQFLDALGPRQETFIYKMYLEEKRHGKEHNYLEIFLVLMSELLARDEAHNKQNHWRKRNQTGPGQGRVNQLQASNEGDNPPQSDSAVPQVEFEPDEAQVLALMDKKKDVVCHKCGRKGHMIKDCWVAHPELIPKGVKVPNTLLSRLGRPATQGGRNGPSQNAPKGPHPPCPHCGKTNHKPDDCFTKYPEKAEAYKASRKTQK